MLGSQQWLETSWTLLGRRGLGLSVHMDDFYTHLPLHSLHELIRLEHPHKAIIIAHSQHDCQTVRITCKELEVFSDLRICPLFSATAVEIIEERLRL